MMSVSLDKHSVTVTLTYLQATRLLRMAQAKLNKLRQYQDFTPAIAELQCTVGVLKAACLITEGKR